MEKNKVKVFVKKHKKAFVISGIALVGVCGGIAALNAKGLKRSKLDHGVDLDNLDWDEFGLLGKVIKWEEASNANAWYTADGNDDFTIADLGKAGEKLVEQFGGMFKPEDEIAGILLCIK